MNSSIHHLRLVFLLLLFTFRTSAQEFPRGEGLVSSAIMNFTEQYEKQMNNLFPPSGEQNLPPSHDPIPLQDFPVPDQYKQKAPDFSGQSGQSIGPDSPAPSTNFQGASDNMSWIPPDVNGAAGPNHLMITLNGTVKIQTRTGGNISEVTLNNFWQPVRNNLNAFDPKILYDPDNARWIFTSCAGSTPGSSYALVGISKTNDPTGLWNLYAIPGDFGSNTRWFDYPSMGYNKDWVVITGNLFTSAGSFQAAKVFALNKSQLIAGGDVSFFYWNITDGTATHVPAVTYDPLSNVNLVFSVAQWNSNGYVRIYTLSGSMASPTYSGTSLYPYTGLSYSYSGADAPQQGSATPVETNDTRFLSVVYRNGFLWATHMVFLNSPSRTAAEWMQINSTTGSVVQAGRVDDPSGVYFYSFPSIAVNNYNDMMLGFSRFSSSQYPAAAYAFRYSTDTPNTLRTPNQFKNGEADYVKTFGGPRNRWGDYSSTFVDPINDRDFWTLQEYAMTKSGSTSRWGTWWAKLNITPITISSVQSGPWNATSTWSCGCIPTSSDLVQINSSHSITINNYTARAKSVAMNPGNIVFVNNGQLLTNE